MTQQRSAARAGRDVVPSAPAGAYFGWWTLVAKLNLALAAGLALPIAFNSLAAALAWRWRKTLESSS